MNSSVGKNIAAVTLGAGSLGAGLMYFFDPLAGRRRRAYLRDKTIHFARAACRNADVTVRDLVNRTVGTFSELEHHFFSEDVPDRILVERVRSRLGRCCSHPHAVDVTAHEGTIHLEGPVLSNEVQKVVNEIRRVPGVKKIHNHFEVYEHPNHIPSLQGGKLRSLPRMDVFQTNWSPATKFLLGIGAGVFGMMASRVLRKL